MAAEALTDDAPATRVPVPTGQPHADNGTDEFIAKQAWLYVSILGGAYFISRGLAKAGSYEPDSDYNPVDLAERKRDGGTDR